jgi:5-methyltetrahydrofolate--homocysteine methyltransferase
MIIIGEKLNSSIPKTLTAFTSNDEVTVVELIKAQEQFGAQYLDINTSICKGEEKEKMEWVIRLMLEHSTCGIMLDSPSPELIKEVIGQVKGRPVIINSITLSERFEELVPVL